jgi:hypothetical protein
MPTRWLAAAAAAVLCAGMPAAGADPSPVRPQVQFSSRPAVAGGQVEVLVTTQDAAGVPVDGPVSIDADAGKLSPPERLGPGQYGSVLQVPRKLPVSGTILFLVRGGGRTAEASLPVVAAAPATLQVVGPPACAGEATACRVEIEAMDAYGNDVAEVPRASAALGRLSAPASEGAGHWVLVYRPPRVDRAEEDRVVVELGSLRAEHRLRITPPRLRFGGAPRVGLVAQGGRLGLAFGAEVVLERLLRSGWLVGAGLEGSWWSTRRSAWVDVPADPDPVRLRVDIDRSQLAFGVLGLAEHPLGRRLLGSLRLGIGAARPTGVAHVTGQPDVTASGWAPAASASVALGYRSSVGMPFAELRATWEGDAHLATDAGAKWPLFLLVGYRFDVR